jgi:hypothetical protein
MAYPRSLTVGQVTLTGVNTQDGLTTFTMDPIANNYQPKGTLKLAYPPFEEGASVSVSAAGDTAFAAFQVQAATSRRCARRWSRVACSMRAIARTARVWRS